MVLVQSNLRAGLRGCSVKALKSLFGSDRPRRQSGMNLWQMSVR